MLIQAFFEGIIAALGALVLELSPPIFGLALSETSLFFFLFTASVEETIKYAFIRNHYLKLKLKEKIISSAFFIGLSFALVDIFIKQLSYEGNFLQLFGIFLVHIFTATLLGLSLGEKMKRPLLLSTIMLGLNIALHFLYNFLILRYS
jgi:hypothetical protein